MAAAGRAAERGWGTDSAAVPPYPSSLSDRYMEVCRSCGEEPHASILASCYFANDVLKQGRPAALEISLCPLEERDGPGLAGLLSCNCPGISAVDIDAEDSQLSPALVLQILRAAGGRLRAVDLTNRHMGREILKDIFYQGLPCVSLNLTGCHVRKLPLIGPFVRLRTLILDHNHHISILPENCFARMPQLARLSLCATSIGNLWTATAALLRLTSLTELRFQHCDCCPHTTAACPTSLTSGKGMTTQQLNKEAFHAMAGAMKIEDSGCAKEVVSGAVDVDMSHHDLSTSNPGTTGSSNLRNLWTVEEPPRALQDGSCWEMQSRDAGIENDFGAAANLNSRQSNILDVRESIRTPEGALGVQTSAYEAKLLQPSGECEQPWSGQVTVCEAQIGSSEPVVCSLARQRMGEGPPLDSTWCRGFSAEPTAMDIDSHSVMLEQPEVASTSYTPQDSQEHGSFRDGECGGALPGFSRPTNVTGCFSQAAGGGGGVGETFIDSMKEDEGDNDISRTHRNYGTVRRLFRIERDQQATSIAADIAGENERERMMRRWNISTSSAEQPLDIDGELREERRSAAGPTELPFVGTLTRSGSGERSLADEREGRWNEEGREWEEGAAEGNDGIASDNLQVSVDDSHEEADHLYGVEDEGIEGTGDVAVMFGERWESEGPFVEESHMEIIPGGFEAPPPSPHLDAQRIFLREGSQRASFGSPLPPAPITTEAPLEIGGGEDMVGIWDDEGVTKRTRKHPSPICEEHYYRAFMVALLPNLQVLDNVHISNDERAEAETMYIEKFEKLANGRKRKENVYHILKCREVGAGISTRRKSENCGPTIHPATGPVQLSGYPERKMGNGSISQPSEDFNHSLEQHVGHASTGEDATSQLPPTLQTRMAVPKATPASSGGSRFLGSSELQLQKACLMGETRGHKELFRAAVLSDEPVGAFTGRNLVHSSAEPISDSVMDTSPMLKFCGAVVTSAGKEGPTGYRRALASARVAGSDWSEMMPVKILNGHGVDIHRRYRPRQFEYNPLEPHLMVVGTLQGEVLVINHETGVTVGQVQSIGAPHSILGLCWLNKDPSKVIGGCDNGSIQLYDVNHMRASQVAALRRTHPGGSPLCSPDPPLGGRPPGRGPPGIGPPVPRSPALYTYEDFEQLTSVHINCTDDVFLASGYSNDVGLYDLRTGRRLQIFPNLHQEHINVLKFAHHSPHLFATSSFDRAIKLWDARQNISSRGPIYSAHSDNPNVMVCFSHDDYFLLSSAVDNEVRQHLAVDGRLHLKLDLKPTRSSHNYTRAYYMNGRDYIVSGSCEENAVRISCARTGRQLRDVAFEGHGHVGRGSKTNPYVQSLRGDPAKDFNFGVLVAYHYPTSRSEIMKVNLMSSNATKHSEKEMRAVPPAGLGA